MLPDGRYEKGPESEPLTLKVGRSGTARGWIRQKREEARNSGL